MDGDVDNDMGDKDSDDDDCAVPARPRVNLRRGGEGLKKRQIREYSWGSVDLPCLDEDTKDPVCKPMLYFIVCLKQG